MPAKTVVFTNVRKYDGKVFRWVSGGEYIQMSGRAGRRGLDDRGIVILMLDERLEPAVAKSMLKGNADPLNSAFHLSYNMILNLMRIEGIAPEKMLEKSFYQFQNNQCLPQLEETLKELKEERHNQKEIENEPEVQQYWELKGELDGLNRDIRKIIYHPSYILPFVQAGRLVWIVDGGKDFGWGCFLSLQKRNQSAKDGSRMVNSEYIIDTLLYARQDPFTGAFAPNQEGSCEMVVVPVTVNAIRAVSSIRMQLSRECKLAEDRKHIGKTLQEVLKRLEIEVKEKEEKNISSISSSIDSSINLSFNSSINSFVPLLDPTKDIGVTDDAFNKLVNKAQLVQNSLNSSSIATSPSLPYLMEQFQERSHLDTKIKLLQRNIQETTAVIHMEELKCRKRVLRRLGFLSADDVIQVKGRVACEISTGDELLLTEMIFNGVFNDLPVEECVALLSCFVFEEKSKTDVFAGANESLKSLHRLVTETATRIAAVSIESKVQLDSETYVESFRPELMSVVYGWCKGCKFSEICKMSDVFEGSIIRCMKRLEELLRQMCLAAKSIGNVGLECKFAEGIVKIKRDIVFANSLYL